MCQKDNTMIEPFSPSNKQQQNVYIMQQQEEDSDNCWSEDEQADCKLFLELAHFFEQNDTVLEAERDDTASTASSSSSYDDDSETTLDVDFSNVYFPDETTTTDYSSTLNDEDEIFLKAPRPLRKYVQFGTVEVREYGVTVGAHTACKDTCALQLTWEYNDEATTMQNVAVHEEQKTGRNPRRLSLPQRRARIARVQGISEGAVAEMEYAVLMKLIDEGVQSLRAANERVEMEARGNNDACISPILWKDNTVARSCFLNEIPPLAL